MSWILCSERLPMATPYSSRVLIVCHYHETPENAHVRMGWLMGDKWHNDKSSTKLSLQDEGFTITHWMPLPPHPPPNP